ncbi:MAG TPA: alkaline phosphatase D family protein, partial [Polyangiaceae bacterium]|nr:alkaline phosphatase D family protein [Polyangiaceae bacterium]
MTLSRRRFLSQATPLGLLPFIPACAGRAEGDAPGSEVAGLAPGELFRHGVASGDPLADAVILWTRVTPPEGTTADGLDVEWRVASDPGLADVVARGSALATAETDFCVKVDVTGLAAASVYYYDFGVLGARSGVGRTKTLPAAGVSRARLAVVSCANYPAGYFTVYRLLAARNDLDLVLHLGDYLYEYANGTYGDGQAIGRIPVPDRELLTLDDYRARHAQYKADADLQELHRQHPMIAVWDDHEIANDGYRDGAANHQPAVEGDWALRKEGAMRAYFEWMPIRPPASGESRVYREFEFGDLFDLILLDTRYAGRDAPAVRSCDQAALEDGARGLLGAEQEGWLFAGLRASSARGARWRLLAQQVMLAQLSDPS